MKAYFKGWLTVLALALAALAMIILASQPARAAGPWYVAPGGDDSDLCTSPGAACTTINGAIAKASSGDTIYVATGTYTGTGDEVVLLNKNVTLSGGWDGTFTTQSGTSTIDGEGSRRGIDVNEGVTATVEGFTVQNGYTGGEGGGIYNAGTLTLNNSTVSGNSAGDGGGIYNWYYRTLTLNNSVVSGNAASGTYGSGGGIRSWHGTITLNSSTVSDNTANWAGGGFCGNPTLTLNNSTVSGNTASAWGGGIYHWDGTVTLNNSTVSGNTAGEGGGIHNRFATLTLNNSTVSGNVASGRGGGIRDWSGTVTLQNTILAGNTAPNGPDCSGTISSAGYNLVGDTSGCDFSPGAGDVTDVNANLGLLIGSPGYYPLLSSSPAIDAVPLGQCTVATDQRGVARPQGPACDMGAYEYTTPGPAASIAAFDGTPQHALPFSVFETPLQALVLDSSGSPVNNATVTFSAPASGASGTFADSGTFTTTALTAESGLATAATFTANGLEGSYTVAATVSGVVTPANFLLSNLGWYVAPGGDDANDCQTPTTPCATINGALGKAGFAAGDTVLAATGTYTDTGNEVVLLDESVRLLGGWDVGFTTQNGISTINGEDARRGITVNSGVTAIVERFTVQNGDTGDDGGGINNNGTVTLNNSTVSGNTADAGGGIANWGTLTLNNSTVSGNTADAGGGIANNGTVTLNNSTVSGNTIGWGLGGGIDNGYGAILTLNNTTVSGNTGSGIYNYYGTLTLNNSTVSGNTASNDGGGICNQGTLTLTNSTVSGNLAQFGGEGAGIFNAGTLTMTNSTVSDNSTGFHFGRGGGIFNQGTLTMINSTIQGNDVFEANGGGGIFNAGRLTIISSTISDNRNTGFFGSGGGVSNAGTLTITNSTVSDNAAASPGGGISNGSGGLLSITNSTISRNAAHYGGAGLSNSGVLTITNTTISSNTTSYYIGMCCGEPIGGSGILNQGTLTLNSTTIAGNSANHVDLDGGGIQNRGQVEFGNTIIAGNITVADDPDCSNSGNMISLGYNLVGENTGCPTVATDQVVNTADIFTTVLGPLRNNGGDTETHALLPNSPAIDAGNPAGCTDHLGNPLTTDQRGFARFGRCDIGAYEMQPTLPEELFLPLILKNHVFAPDLVVDSLVATSGAVTVTIRNAGTAAVIDAFWVDVYFNPSVTPGLNQPWDTIASHGVVWGITTTIQAGDSVVLTTGGDYYFPEYSSPAPLPVGADVYALVDSINYDTTCGAVLESNEGNNLYGPVTSTAATGQAAPIVDQGQPPSREGLPPRR